MANQGSNGVAGQLGIGDHTSDVNHSAFMFHQMLGRASTMKLVKVVKVNVKQDGGIAEAGTVDVVPLVNQVDGLGEKTKHGTVYGLQYTRIQSGAFAIVHDPQVGDIGYAVVADRDTSAVIKKKDQANPGSHRRYDIADGVYMGGILNKKPSQYVQVVHSTKDDGTGGTLSMTDANGNFVTMTATKDDPNDPNSKTTPIVTVKDGNNNVVTMTAQKDQNDNNKKKAVMTLVDGNGNTMTMDKNGVIVKDNNKNVLTMNSGGVTVDTQQTLTLQTKDGLGNVVVNGTVQAKGNVISGYGGADQVSLQGHIHGTTPPPNPGS